MVTMVLDFLVESCVSRGLQILSLDTVALLVQMSCANDGNDNDSKHLIQVVDHADDHLNMEFTQ